MTFRLVPLVLCGIVSINGSCQDRLREHPNSYKVEIDNSQVRVIRSHHAPHEKVGMHSHPAGVLVYLSDVQEKSTFPDGTSRVIVHHAGDVVWSPPRTHILENLADTPIDVIEIEIKTESN